jgi:hypothetical protein
MKNSNVFSWGEAYFELCSERPLGLMPSISYHPSAVNLLFRSSQLAYRKGEYEEALRSLDTWVKSKEERPLNALNLYNTRALPMPGSTCMMISK